MKRIMIAVCGLLMLAAPPIVRAQNLTAYNQVPDQYRDVDNGQLLQLVSYLLTPLGMGLEWGVARPLHYAATQTSMAPLLSGDTKESFFGQNDNADQVPPGTFGPYLINPTNEMVSTPEEQVLMPLEQKSAMEPSDTEMSPARVKPQPGGQPALH